MATRQRGSQGRASASKQPGLREVTTSAISSTELASPTADGPAEDGAREQRIAVSAYLRAAQRGFSPGHELEDWLAAERELEASGQIDLRQQ